MNDKKILLITGATRGIGFTTAVRFAKEGYTIAINDINEQAGKEAIEKLRGQGFDADFFLADITKEEEINAMVKEVGEKHGRIDVLVNNAGGLLGRNPVETMETSFWNKVLDLNLNAPFYATRAVIPYMKKVGGSIINITSIAAYNGGGPGIAAYATAKAGVLAFTRATAKEFIPYNIRVNAVSPGVVDTEFHSQTSKELMEGWKQGIPAKRFGTPDDVANCIYFLTSDEASYLVGEVIQINGGQDFR
ncbi:SDR family oxidoreductase [Clostridium bovifaecis]|uniref:SDR family oxidoreductase n=1 Tax=Clostridium bovifaecis TaxID=2184719 RepID=A0A6I6F1U2_9CLOT|nr:SDR family oxidoreductase [Clostridium bovifaecis]